MDRLAMEKWFGLSIDLREFRKRGRYDEHIKMASELVS